MILRGQNFRIFIADSSGGSGTVFKCVGMATNCTVNLQNNSEDASTKDSVGMASMPVTTSQTWSVQAESLNVEDTSAILSQIKSLTPFLLVWDETSTTDNQTGRHETFGRVGKAWLNDVTFKFDDRTNSSKSLQFVGAAPLEALTDEPYATIAAGSYTKGQFVRLFLSSDNTATPSKVILASKSLSLHVSLTLEDATSKDTPGSFQVQEPTGLSYDISATALARGADTITSQVQAQDLTSLESICETGTPVKWEIANVSGDNQRTKGTVLCSGSVLLTQVSIKAQNKSAVTYDLSMSGYGIYNVPSAA